MKINSKLIAYNFLFTIILFFLSGFFYDFVKYKRFFPIDDVGLINARGKKTKNKISNEFNCYGLHPYLGFINACTNFNSKGFIKEHNLKENQSFGDEKVFRLLILGGSVANHLSRNNIFEDQLIKSFNKSNSLKGIYSRVEIINTALGGYKQPQQLFALGYLLAQGYKFESIINISGFNEIALPLTENYNEKISPILPRDHARREDKESFLVSPYRHLRKISNLHPLTRFLYPKINSLVSKSVNTKKNKPYSFDLPNNKEEAFKLSKNIWVQSSNMSYEISNYYQIPYFEFIQPNQYVESSKIFTEKEKKEKILSYDLMPYRKPIEDFYLKINPIDFSIPDKNIIDLRYIFINQSNNIYADACCHFNDLGNILLSKNISDYIVKYLENK